MKADDLHRLSDRDLVAQLTSFHTQLAASPADYGLLAADATALNASIGKFDSDLNTLDGARTAVDAAVQVKTQSRKDLVELARQQFKVARAVPGQTNEKLAAANLDPYDSIATPSGAPTGVPIAVIDLAKLRHIINFRDAGTPTSTAKPDGVMGCEIWVKLDGTPPADEKECTFVALDTATPYVANYDGADGGKTAHYLLRWISKGGEKGVWSEVITATIPK